MNKLEDYLDKYDNKELDSDIFNQYINFGYDNEILYKFHLNYMLNNLYNIKITEPKRKRLNQKEFREEIVKKFNGKCVVSDETCIDELTASHIIPVSENENYDVDNGLLLRENIHKTFDKFKWSINPNTLLIEIKKNINVGSIRDYEGKKIDIDLNETLKNNLEWHYNKFMKI